MAEVLEGTEGFLERSGRRRAWELAEQRGVEPGKGREAAEKLD